MLRNLPEPLYAKVYNWDESEKTPSRIKFDGLRPRMVYRQKNDGQWKKVRIVALDPEKHLRLAIRNVGAKGDDTTTFDVVMRLKAEAHYHQINWQQGLKLWDATADARVRVNMVLRCEATTRLEKTGGPLPELVYRLRVVRADVSYDEFEVTHIAGVGGDLAKLLGDTVRKVVLELKPSLEERLLEKGEKAIVKAADTQELRLGLGGLKRKKME